MRRGGSCSSLQLVQKEDNNIALAEVFANGLSAVYAKNVGGD